MVESQDHTSNKYFMAWISYSADSFGKHSVVDGTNPVRGQSARRYAARHDLLELQHRVERRKRSPGELATIEKKLLGALRTDLKMDPAFRYTIYISA